jgi:hypothetical protein
MATGHAVRPALHDAILKRVDLSANVNNLESEQSKQQKEDDCGQRAATAIGLIPATR